MAFCLNVTFLCVSCVFVREFCYIWMSVYAMICIASYIRAFPLHKTCIVLAIHILCCLSKFWILYHFQLDMATSIPKEYLTLRAGPSNNYASVYDNIGEYNTLHRISRGRENGCSCKKNSYLGFTQYTSSSLTLQYVNEHTRQLLWNKRQSFFEQVTLKFYQTLELKKILL